MDIGELKEIVLRDDLGKEDQFISYGALMYAGLDKFGWMGCCATPVDWTVDARERAFDQFSERVDVPATFIRKCSEELREEVFSEFIPRKTEQKAAVKSNNPNHGAVFVRFRNDVCRAVLTSDYVVLDNSEVVVELEKALENNPIDIQKAYISDDYFRIYVKFNFVDAKLLVDGEELVMGYTLVNSETGAASLKVEPVVMFRGKESGFVALTKKYLKKAHKGAVEIKSSGLKDILKNTLNAITESTVEQMDFLVGLAGKKLYGKEMIDSIIDVWGEEGKVVPKKLSKRVKEQFSDVEEVSKLKVAVSLLDLVYDEIPHERAVDISRSVSEKLRKEK